MKLFTIGDSVSQGFMSGAAARTDLSYSTLIARSMQLSSTEYRYPNVWGANGLPLNLEELLRSLGKKYGTNIGGLEWLTAWKTALDFIKTTEEYYERGNGAANKPDPTGAKYFNNIAIQGFDVADSWLVTPRECKLEIAKAEKGKDGGDNFAGLPNANFHRTALKVLNPSLDPKYDDYSQLKWLEHHATQEGIENVIIWLGANNALGTVIGFHIKETPNAGRSLTHLSHNDREQWNLWHPNDFALEYAELLDRVDEILKRNLSPNCNVFIGTVPLVTIAPFAKGVGSTGPESVISDFNGTRDYLYYDYYTYFFRNQDAIETKKNGFLTRDQVIYIDACIRQYNLTIKELVAKKNQQYAKPRYHIVDTSKALQDIAYKRNDGHPTYQYPDYFKTRTQPVNTKYYHVDETGRLQQGGIFSLDGIHPSAIGQGLIAYEFLKVMQPINGIQPTSLNWDAIFKSDRLYNDPIPLMHELYENDNLAELFISRI